MMNDTPLIMILEYEEGLRAQIADLMSEAGSFLRFNNGDFMDFGHFMGNETYFARHGSMNGYSILPYYDFSTSQYYVSTYGLLDMRNFLLTRIPKLRFIGINEYIIANHLYTPTSGHFAEVVYSINNLFRAFRLDFTTAFDEGGFREFRVQVGLSLLFFNGL